MAKLKNPLLSFISRGKFGDITFKRSRRLNIDEKTPVIKDAASEPQLTWRTMYQKCAILWHALSGPEKAEWEALGTTKHMTGFAYWQSQCLRPNPGIYLPLAGGSMQGAIDMGAHAITDLPDPVAPQDADTKAARDAAITAGGYTQGARVYHSVNQSIPNITGTALAFNSERWDTDSIHDPVTNNNRLTCQTAGKYLILAMWRYATSPTGQRTMYLRLNGSIYIAQIVQNTVSVNQTHMEVTTIYDLAVADYVEAIAFQNSGGPLNIEIDAQRSPEFMMQRIG